MIKNKVQKMLLAGVLACGMAVNGVSTAYATINTDVKGSATGQIDIEIKATNVDVTVPATAPFVFNEDESTTTPSNWKVINNSEIARVYLSKVSVDGTEAGWKVVDGSYDLKTMAVNTKNIRLKFGKEGEEKLVSPVDSASEGNVGEYTFDPSDIVVPAQSEQVLKFNIERGSFTNAEASAKAYEMTLEFNFS